MVDEQIRLN